MLRGSQREWDDDSKTDTKVKMELIKFKFATSNYDREMIKMPTPNSRMKKALDYYWYNSRWPFDELLQRRRPRDFVLGHWHFPTVRCIGVHRINAMVIRRQIQLLKKR